MYNNILQDIDNIEIWPIISFVIFFLFFLVLVWWAFTVDKGFINEMKEMPLHDGVKGPETEPGNPSRQ